MEDLVKCELCGEYFKSISTTHLGVRHKISFIDYTKMFPNSTRFSKKTLSIRKITLKLQIQKYGLEEGTKRYNEYCQKQANTNSYEYKREKYGWTIEQFNEYNSSRSVTLNNMINKYGIEIGTQKFNEYCEKQKTAGCSLSYFINKLGLEEGTSFYKALNLKKAQTLENFIKKYGKIIGEEKYVKMITNGKISTFTISKPHKLFLELLSKLIPEHWIIHEGLSGKEFHHWDMINKKNYFYDFVVTFPFKAIIEFNGDFWHANPKIYNENDIISIPVNKKTAGEIWEYDRKKQELLTNKGFSCKIIWDGDFQNNIEETIEECIQWLKSLEKK